MDSNNNVNWIEYYKSVGLNLNYVKKYDKYISKLVNNNLPVIFEFNHLSLLLGVQKPFLNKVIYSTQFFYRTFYIPKKYGGEREILAPYPTLLLIQYWIYENILKNITIHKCAHAFTGNKSIITNSWLHVGQDEILKIDLKDFFPSISFNRIIYFFRSIGYANNVSYYLARLCTYSDYLPQGAPTSPILSNIIARKLDNRLFKLSQNFGLKYSRYADDIVFSGRKIPVKFIEYINAIIHDEGFEINNKKTKLYRNGNKKIITGIVVDSETIKIPREYKRELKQTLNYVLKYGFDSHVSKKKIRDIHYLERILGQVNFWLQVEPNNEFAKKAKIYLTDELRRKINYNL